mgnify:CR=1 FL=1
MLVIDAHLRLARVEPLDECGRLGDDPASRRFFRAAIAGAEPAGRRDQAPAVRRFRISRQGGIELTGGWSAHAANDAAGVDFLEFDGCQ